MKLQMFKVDAFTSEVFKGNPAAVCPLERWLPDEMLQAIAAENNLSETAFFVSQGEGFHLRWMTPTTEVSLCGHATLASGYVLLMLLEPGRQEVCFSSASGPLVVRKDGSYLAMDFPSWETTECEPPEPLVRALGRAPREVRTGRDYLVVYDTEEQVRALAPDMALLSTLERQGIIVTAPGRHSDFVSRYFAPAIGVPEDPVTGSSHCALTPYWAARFNKSRLHAFQVSKRGGELFCELRGDRVTVSGSVVRYMEGTVYLP